MPEHAKEFFDRVVSMFNQGDRLHALDLFQRYSNINSSNPVCNSYLALLIASERGPVQYAINMAAEAIKEAPNEPLLYLNMAKIHIMASRKDEALALLRKSFTVGRIQETEALLKALNPRMTPLFPSLPRKHFLNKYTGMIRHKLGL